MNCARMFGPFVSSLIIKLLNWRYVYVICAIAALSRFVNVSMIRNIEMKKKEFDIWGAVFLIICTSSLCISLTLVAQTEWTIAGGCFIGAIIYSIVFYLWERQYTNPIVDMKVISP